jgi:membrane protein YdbS with pleckstrin-like domain
MAQFTQNMMRVKVMSEIDSVKEEISFFRSLIVLILTALFAVTGWYVLYEKEDVKSGLALVAIVSLIAAWLVIQSMMFKLIRKLKEL